MLEVRSRMCTEYSAYDGFFGDFASIRSRLDYDYHSCHDKERQLMQDGIIKSFLSRGRPTTDPWVIFTAGPMGSGKSFVCAHLKEKGLLPIKDFVQVDPDSLREYLPEYKRYLFENAQTAGFLTQSEAGLMAEILTHAALGQGMSVIIDGSLRDSAWYESHFRDLRALYPKVRLAICSVTAPMKDIYQRVRDRALQTGRQVPLDVLQDSICRVPLSVKKLRKHVNVFVEIHNAQETGVRITKIGTSRESGDTVWFLCRGCRIPLQTDANVQL